MKSWFTSLDGVVTISALAMLSFIGYTLMEMRYYLAKWIPGDGAAMIETIAILVIVGGWLRALAAARDGKGGLSWLLGFAIFDVLIGLYDMQYVLNTGMPWPEMSMVLVTLVVGLIAAGVVGMYMRGGKNKTARARK